MSCSPARADDAAAGVLDVGRDHGGKFLGRHRGGAQCFEPQSDDDLLFVAADAVDVRDSRDRAEQGLHAIFVQQLEFHQLLAARGGLAGGSGRVIEGVVEYFPEAVLTRASRGVSPRGSRSAAPARRSLINWRAR